MHCLALRIRDSKPKRFLGWYYTRPGSFGFCRIGNETITTRRLIGAFGTPHRLSVVFERFKWRLVTRVLGLPGLPQIAEQIRALATKYDEAFNQNDAAAVAAFITEDAVWITPHGTLSGRQAIQKDYADLAFRRYHCNNVSTKCDQVNKFGDDTKHVKGHFTWIIVREVVRSIIGRSARIPTTSPDLIKRNRLDGVDLNQNACAVRSRLLPFGLPVSV